MEQFGYSASKENFHFLGRDTTSMPNTGRCASILLRARVDGCQWPNLIKCGTSKD
jgi:hypothetical protein